MLQNRDKKKKEKVKGTRIIQEQAETNIKTDSLSLRIRAWGLGLISEPPYKIALLVLSIITTAFLAYFSRGIFLIGLELVLCFIFIGYLLKNEWMLSVSKMVIALFFTLWLTSIVGLLLEDTVGNVLHFVFSFSLATFFSVLGFSYLLNNGKKGMWGRSFTGSLVFLTLSVIIFTTWTIHPPLGFFSAMILSNILIFIFIYIFRQLRLVFSSWQKKRKNKGKV